MRLGGHLAMLMAEARVGWKGNFKAVHGRDSAFFVKHMLPM